MKAEHLKKHLKKVEIEEQEDKWGDKLWIVEGRKFYDYKAAKKAVDELITKEFNERIKKK